MSQMICIDVALVPMRQDTLNALLGFRESPNESLDDVVIRLAKQREPAGITAPLSLHGSVELRTPCSFELFGVRYSARTARDLLVSVLRLLHELDPGILPELSRYRARKRRYVARSPDQLYPGRPDLARYSVNIADGWWVGTNHSKRDIERILRAACSVSGLAFGKDLVVVM